jgi:glycosyltransferase involved in cell wall biosynthesis
MLSFEMSPNCRACVVIPCLNEIDLIDSTVKTIVASLEALTQSDGVEVIYVDNGSTDGTKEYLDDLARKVPNIGVITEPVAGIGHARRAGARLAMARAAARQKPVSDAFWHIATDADVTVPAAWLDQWLQAFTATSYLILAGQGHFPDALANRFPNASKALERSGETVRRLVEIFGAINIECTNSAIERKAYAAIGPFTQPMLTNGGKVQTLAGTDWDMSTRGRILGLSVGDHNGEPVIVSSRRFEHDIKAFFTGKAYDNEFLRVDARSDLPDLQEADIAEQAAIAVHRLSMHFVCKPILAEPQILDQKAVRSFLGKDTVEAMKAWISKTSKPDMFTDRNGFILGYLADFHQLFGDKITQRALSLWGV